jgi:uncharacterized protein
METMKVRETGRIHTYTIVYRTFPGVKTPFISAAIAMDGGANLHGTVRDLPTDARDSFFNLPVRLKFEDSGQRAPDGVPFLAYYFVPITD